MKTLQQIIEELKSKKVHKCSPDTCRKVGSMKFCTGGTHDHVDHLSAQDLQSIEAQARHIFKNQVEENVGPAPE